MDKDIKRAISEAEAARLEVRPNAGRSRHTWGHIVCTCGESIAVYSTGRNPAFGAKLIRNFIRKHKEHM